MALADVDHRGPFRIYGMLVPQDLVQQLNALGLHPGSILAVLHHQGAAGLVVTCGTSRIALSAELARRIRVIPFAGEKA